MRGDPVTHHNQSEHKLIAEFIVNNSTSREKICSGLIEAGYVIEVEERTKRPYVINDKNFYVIIYENTKKKDKEA